MNDIMVILFGGLGKKGKNYIKPNEVSVLNKITTTTTKKYFSSV